MGAAAHVGGWFLAPPPSLVKFRAWVCKTAGPLECEKNSPIRILRFQRRAGPSVLFPARRPQQTPGATGETAGTSAAGPVLSALPSIRKPQQAPGAARETAGASRRRAGSVCPPLYQEAAAGPRSHQGDRRGHRRRARSVCPTPCQGAAAGPRSHQGDHRCLRRRAVLSVLPPARRPQQAPGATRETTGASAAGPFCLSSPLPGGRSRPQEPPGRPQGHPAAGPVTFNARRDYELLEQVVSTYGR